MNILEIAPMQGTKGNPGVNRHSQEPVIYSWQKRTHNPKSKSGIAFRIRCEPLNKARYVNGDRASFDISDDMKFLTISIGPKGNHALSGASKQSKKSGSRTTQLKYQGIEQLKPIFPEADGPVPLKIISISEGKIVCWLPEQ